MCYIPMTSLRRVLIGGGGGDRNPQLTWRPASGAEKRGGGVWKFAVARGRHTPGGGTTTQSLKLKAFVTFMATHFMCRDEKSQPVQTFKNQHKLNQQSTGERGPKKEVMGSEMVVSAHTQNLPPHGGDKKNTITTNLK